MRFLKAAIVLGLIAAPSPLFAAQSADIEAKGNSPAFCNISNDGGMIKMDVSSDFDKLSGKGKYNYVANGSSKVVLSAVSLVAPKGAEAATPSLELVDLVANASSSAEASSKASDGAVRQGGEIEAAITQDNAKRLLTTGDYALSATATCTSL